MATKEKKSIDEIKAKLDDLEQKHSEPAEEAEYLVAEILEDDLVDMQVPTMVAIPEKEPPKKVPIKQPIPNIDKRQEPQATVTQQKVMPQQKIQQQQPTMQQQVSQSMAKQPFDVLKMPQPRSQSEFLQQFNERARYILWQKEQMQVLINQFNNLRANFEISRRNEAKAVEALKQMVTNGDPQSKEKLNQANMMLRSMQEQLRQVQTTANKLQEQYNLVNQKLQASSEREQQATAFAREKEKDYKVLEMKLNGLQTEYNKVSDMEKKLRVELQKAAEEDAKLKQDFATYKKNMTKEGNDILAEKNKLLKEQEDLLKKLNVELKKSEDNSEKLKTKLAEANSKKGGKATATEETAQEDSGKTEQLVKALEASEGEMETVKAFAKRIQDDFNNYKKRSANLSNEMKMLGMSKVVAELLPVLDNIGFAKDQIKDKDALIGFTMLETQIIDALKKFGLKEVETEGAKFDPNLMSAILQVEGKPGYVVEVVSKGYLLEETLIRPAQVKVGKDG